MPDNDSLGVADYWDVTDYVGLKADKKYIKQSTRNGEPRHTPISKYVNGESAFFIRQFKSPRSNGMSVPAE